MSEVIVTRVDTHSIGYCNSGVREYWASHGLNWQVFLRDGLPIAAFDHVKDDPMIRRLLDAAVARQTP